MKKLFCILMVVCLFLVGFTIGRRSTDIYLKDNESVYIGRYDKKLYVWLYTLDQVNGTWAVEQIYDTRSSFTSFTVHFVEPIY